MGCINDAHCGAGAAARLIRVAGPSITEKEVAWVAQAVRDGWHENYQKYVRLFEERFAGHTGRKYALATSSGSGALHLAYLALGLKERDEVIVPNLTWIASVAPISYLGAKPVFADVEQDTLCIDPNDIEDRITPNTKAILVVHLYGHMADMGPIIKIARKHRLRVIEDAAQAVGAVYKGKPAGSFGDVSIFSFTGTKTLVTGEGGMLLTDSKRIVDSAAYYNNHSQDKKRIFWNLEVGYKYRMSNIQAACGIAQLERLSELVQKKRAIFSWYESRLADVETIRLNCERKGTTNSYWMVTAIIDKSHRIGKEWLMERLNEYGIQSRPLFYPLSELPPFKMRANTPVSYDVSPRGINLPSAHDITEREVDYVCGALRAILKL